MLPSHQHRTIQGISLSVQIFVLFLTAIFFSLSPDVHLHKIYIRNTLLDFKN